MQTLSQQIHRNPLPFRSWRTTNQIIIFTLILALITLCITITTLQIALQYASAYLRDISKNISDSQTQNELLISSYYQLRYTKSYFRSGIQTLSSINDLYQFVQNKNISLESPTECLTPLNNPLSLYPQFCYAKFEPELANDTNEQQFNKLTSLMDLYAQLFDLTKLTYYAFNEDGQYASAYNYSVPISYRPHSRPWYQEHSKAISTQKTKQLYRISDPYISYVTETIMVTETMSLLKTSGELDGVSAQNSKFPHIPQTSDSYAQPLIVDLNGKLLTYKINGVKAEGISSIYTTNYTGFTEADWQELKSISKVNVFVIRKIYNQVKKEYVQISATKLNSYFLFLYIDDIYFRNIIDKIIHSINNFYSQLYTSVILTGISILIFVLFLQIIAIKFFFLKDLMKLFIIAENQILKHSILFTQLKVQESSSEIRELFISYYKALTNISNNERAQKNEKCKSLELLTYPIQSKQKECKRYFKTIQKDLVKISNSNCYILYKQQQRLFFIIQQSFKQYYKLVFTNYEQN